MLPQQWSGQRRSLRILLLETPWLVGNMRSRCPLYTETVNTGGRDTPSPRTHTGRGSRGHDLCTRANTSDVWKDQEDRIWFHYLWQRGRRNCPQVGDDKKTKGNSWRLAREYLVQKCDEKIANVNKKSFRCINLKMTDFNCDAIKQCSFYSLPHSESSLVVTEVITLLLSGSAQLTPFAGHGCFGMPKYMM